MLLQSKEEQGNLGVFVEPLLRQIMLEIVWISVGVSALIDTTELAGRVLPFDHHDVGVVDSVHEESFRLGLLGSTKLESELGSLGTSKLFRSRKVHNGGQRGSRNRGRRSRVFIRRSVRWRVRTGDGGGGGSDSEWAQ